jgi:SAM-dependent methyltransferase
MVRHARTRIPDASERLRRGTIDRLPFDDASFDAAAATGVLEYVESVPDALGELSRVLRPGGRAVISVPNSRSFHAFSRRSTDPIARLAKRAFHRTSVQLARRDRIPPLDRLPRILNDAGLQVTDIRHVAALVIPAPLDRLMPATSQRLGRAAEDRPRLRRLAATQVVIGVRKGGAPDGVPAALADR